MVHPWRQKPFALDRLNEPSRAPARALLGRFPLFECHCRTWGDPDREGRLCLDVRIPSPAGSDRDVQLWWEKGEGVGASLGFGDDDWHTHETHFRETAIGECEEESLMDLLDAILHDRVVLYDEPHADPPLRGDVLDLRNPDALMEVLTSFDGSGGIRIRSFTGRIDRGIGIEDPPA